MNIYSVSRKKEKALFLLLLLLLSTLTLSSQRLLWDVGLHNFFDNYEFGNHSKIHPSNTMSGVHVAPKIGVSWEGKHRLLVGVDMMKEYGSRQPIDYFYPIAYYDYETPSFRFKMGAFPRRHTLDHYPRIFFSDTITNYRPVVNGLFWEVHGKKNFFNVWLDWTSRRTATDRETFLLGWSGRYHLKPFYLQHVAYMYHYAYSYNLKESEDLHDYGLLLGSLGIDLSQKSCFDNCSFEVGCIVGLERKRDKNQGVTRVGLYSEANIEWAGIELKNTLYLGQGQQFFYEEGLPERYWGDEVFREARYNRSDLSLHLLRSPVANVRATYSLHFTREAIYHQQTLYATFDLDNYKEKRRINSKSLFCGWMRR